MNNWSFSMRAEEADPINSGTMESWFEFYKVKAGVTHVSVTGRDVKPGDMLWFVMDGVARAGARVTAVSYNIRADKYDVYYDSDDMLPGDAAGPTAVTEVR